MPGSIFFSDPHGDCKQEQRTCCSCASDSSSVCASWPGMGKMAGMATGGDQMASHSKWLYFRSIHLLKTINSNGICIYNHMSAYRGLWPWLTVSIKPNLNTNLATHAFHVYLLWVKIRVNHCQIQSPTNLNDAIKIPVPILYPYHGVSKFCLQTSQIDGPHNKPRLWSPVDIVLFVAWENKPAFQ